MKKVLDFIHEIHLFKSLLTKTVWFVLRLVSIEHAGTIFPHVVNVLKRTTFCDKAKMFAVN